MKVFVFLCFSSSLFAYIVSNNDNSKIKSLVAVIQHNNVCGALTPPPASKSEMSTNEVGIVLQEAWDDAISSGLSGAIAGGIQVLLLMWLRTTIHYQHRYGLNTLDSLKILYSQGGIPRFYKGITFALIQAPLSRFGSAAANAGALRLSAHFSTTDHHHVLVTTILGTILASLWRMVLMPIDTCKTVLQVEGTTGFQHLMDRVAGGQLHLLFEGTLATMLGAALSHYAWFIIYNSIDFFLHIRQSAIHNVVQNALLGFSASAFADLISNPIRVLKTVKQAMSADGNYSYLQIIHMIIEKDGVQAFFSRGLWTRMVSNGIQSMIFTVLWKSLYKKNRRRRGRK